MENDEDQFRRYRKRRVEISLDRVRKIDSDWDECKVAQHDPEKFAYLYGADLQDDLKYLIDIAWNVATMPEKRRRGL